MGHSIDREKVIKGLERCKLYNKVNCDKCPYDYNGRGNGKSECTAELASDALVLLKEQQKLIGDTPHWIFGNSYGRAWMKCSNCCVSQSGQTSCWSYCPNCGAKMEGQVKWE